MNLQWIAAKLKRSPLVAEACEKTKSVVTNYHIAEIGTVCAREDTCDDGKIRWNLITPSVDKKHVFGGIATALRFFEEVAGCNKESNVRIISVDAPVFVESKVVDDKYVIVKSDQDSKKSAQLVEYCDRYQKSIPVRKRDVFIATGWWTAYTFKNVIEWQAQHYQQKVMPLVYLIQDYEPGFYAWSSRYLLADSTYRMNIPIFAVMNSKLLKEFFDKQGYEFTKTWYFEPVLNTSLRKFMPEQDQTVTKKKQIMIYGRPGTARNAFEVIVEALKQWAQKQADAGEWKVYSAGESHNSIELGNGAKLVSVGKLTLEEYATYMKETYAGISLMVSPHPSYPPLEMSTFGIRTITNTYENKDLSKFSPNIISVKSAAPECIAEQLCKLCDTYNGEGRMYVKNSYVQCEKEFGDIGRQITKEIKEWHV